MANTSFKKPERKVRKLTVSVSDLGHDVVALNSQWLLSPMTKISTEKSVVSFRAGNQAN